MDPSQTSNMMRAAQDVFAKMTPEQRAAMEEQVANMDPAQMKQAMDMMNSMTPEQRAEMERMARETDPEELLRRSRAATSAHGQTMSSAERLKNEGNALFREKKYAEACEKYRESLLVATEGGTKKSCLLNLASCRLQLGQFELCVGHCDDVLKVDSGSMKAYYRRGDAYMRLNRKWSAVRDLEKALGLATIDQDRNMIEEKLQIARNMESDEVEELVEETIIEEVTMVDQDNEKVVIEEVEYHRETRRTGVDPLKEAMQNDPNAIKNAAKMLENMDPATLEQMMKNMPGAPAGMSVDPSMMKMAAKMMENMSPEDIQRMQDMSRAFASTGGASSTSSVPGNPMQNFSPSSMEDMKKMAQNPVMLKQMQQMLKGMDPEALCSMMKASGVNVTQDQAKKMVDQLGNLNDKQIERIAKVAHIIGAVASAYQKTKEYAKKNPLMVFAVIALLLALFLRWKGIM